MSLRTKVLASAATFAVAAMVGSAAWAQIANYSNVTQQRLDNPEPRNWLHYRGNYEGWGHSPLRAITAENANRLQPVWSFSTGVVEGHQGPPQVNDGIMYITTPRDQLIALDAKSGEELWRYRHELPDDVPQSHPTKRGVGFLGEHVFMTTTDMMLVKIEAKTGKIAWSIKVDDWKQGYFMTLAPLVAKGKIMVGPSGGERGIRGYVAAYDAETGRESWRRYTTAAPGEPGGDTWPGDTYKTGASSVWITGTYNPRTGISYWGTGNGGPWMGDQRPGDNLYTTSVMAINVDNGQLTGHFQYHQNDSWDWDEVSAAILMPVERNGQTIQGLVHPARNGFLWKLEALNDGKINYVDAKAYVKQNVFTAVDPRTGRVTVDPAKKPGTGKLGDFCPSLWGGKDWPPAAYSPDTKLLYIPANENMCGKIQGGPVTYRPGQSFTHGGTSQLYIAPGADYFGELQAWDVNKMEKTWSHKFANSQNWGPVLSTGGNLVFMGGTNDRMFRAWDSRNGQLKWEFKTNSGITGVPSSFEVDGKQYVAVQAGWGVDAQRMQAQLVREAPTRFRNNVPQGGVVWVFAVP